jgi:hypothetical protein
MLPLVPIVLYYVRLESSYSILPVDDYASYFVWASNAIFSSTTFQQVWPAPILVLWYVVAVALVATSWRNPDRPTIAGVVAAGVFLAGFPAMQAHSILFGKAMWERYVVLAAWVHWPLLAMFVSRFWGRAAARWAAGVALGFSMFHMILGSGLSQIWTFDHRAVVEHLEQHARPGDAFFAQDVDVWVGPANFERLWFERYATIEMPVITARPMSRGELIRRGAPLDVADRSIHRIWIYSTMFDETMLRSMQTEQWKLVQLYNFDGTYPLAFFERNAES